MKIIIAVFIFSVTIKYSNSENILGCGGFVKSHVPIDYSRVEVKLLTKQGILKDKINCAPNNGYYFVPLYDKGEYILELEPPPGWSFTPTKVDLIVDGVSDLCSQGKDINFSFKGFGITGKVESLGSDTGPEGIVVELIAESETRKTLTSKGGTFFFTPVYPGNYVVKISSEKWELEKRAVTVHVTEGNTELSPQSLIVQGYSVSGFVKDEGEPIKDSTVILYAKEKLNHKVSGCDKTSLPNLPGPDKPICHVKTNEQGLFKFGTVPHGKYFVVPYNTDRNIFYQPNSIDFDVNHDDIRLKDGFEIIGFNIYGRVLKAPNEKPLAQAKILSNGEEVARTDANGMYMLEIIKAGVYNLQAVADGFLFKEFSIKVKPSSKIPDLVPVSYKVCGRVLSDKSQKIIFMKLENNQATTSLSDSTSGHFCEYLNPGKYNVQVAVDSDDLKKGLQFFPKTHTIDVVSEQTQVISFSQLKATIEGQLKCFQKEDCEDITISIKPVEQSSEKNTIILGHFDGKFKIPNMNPGLYDIALTENRMCWKVIKQTINVNSEMVQVPAFTQIGYNVFFSSSHDTQVSYRMPNDTKKISVPVAKGRSSICLEKIGSYDFELDSCHSYENNLISYSTASSKNEIFLNAIKHTLTLLIESESKIETISATVSIGGVKLPTETLTYAQNGYQIKLNLSPGETAVIVPHSDVLYFTPPILSVTGKDDCEDLGGKLKAVLGIVFQGKIKPPLPGVLVTVETENFDTLMTETDENGVYKFPPLDTSKTYKIGAKKDSFVLVGPNEQGDFLAHKLAEIIIEVLDNKTATPLQGTLLSLSGGDSYRSNLQTNENGKISFHSLSPGEYFLRPMMKEYSFNPSSKIVTVNEGETVNVQLTGKRVAYSAYGIVTSLNREPEERVSVVATGVGNCSHFSEESTSEANGQFRIRGLQPYCSYDITVKNNLDGSRFIIERSAPKVIRIESVTSDILALQLVIFRPLSQMDVLLKVYAKNPDHYKTLRLKIVSETSPSNVVYTARIDTSSIALTADSNHGVLVHIPPLPLDGRTYSVHLESSLNNRLEPEAQDFIANSSFQYVELNFIVTTNTSEQDIKQTSVWTLIFIFTIMLAVYNIDKISQFLKDSFGSYVSDLVNSTMKKSTPTDYTVDNVDIDQIVQSINAVKKKPKARRVM